MCIHGVPDAVPEQAFHSQQHGNQEVFQHCSKHTLRLPEVMLICYTCLKTLKEGVCWSGQVFLTETLDAC